MKIRLFLAALCIFLLPLCFADSNGNASQFSAYASGYMVGSGDSCECEGPEANENCICGESLRTDPNDNQATASNLGSESLLILAALMLWIRLRA